MGQVVPDQVGWKILKLLGINQDMITEAHIHIRVNDIITADIKCYVQVDGEFVKNEAGELITVLKKYCLKEIDETEKE